MIAQAACVPRVPAQAARPVRVGRPLRAREPTWRVLPHPALADCCESLVGRPCSIRPRPTAPRRAKALRARARRCLHTNPKRARRARPEESQTAPRARAPRWVESHRHWGSTVAAREILPPRFALVNPPEQRQVVSILLHI